MPKILKNWKAWAMKIELFKSNRKYTGFLLVVLISSVLVWFGKIDGTVWGSTVTLVTGAYFGMNAIQKKWIKVAQNEE